MNHTHVTYKWFEKRIKDTPPFRGTLNRFPMTSRKKINYHFLLEQENGQNVFDICYGFKWERVTVSKEAGELLAKKNENVHQAGDGSAFYYDKTYNRVLRVRPDNSFEFIADDYHQGNRQFLNKLFLGNFFNDSRRGGVLYSSASKMMPIFRGLRVDADMKPLNDVKVTINTVNRKKSREFLKRYERFFKVSEVMMRSMSDKEMWAATVVDIANQHIRPARNRRYDKRSEAELMEKISTLMDDAPLDAFVLAAIHYDTHLSYWIAENGKYPPWHRHGFDMEAIFNTTKRSIINSLYKSSPDLFIPHTFPAGERFASTNWGVHITADDKPVEQCGYSRT